MDTYEVIVSEQPLQLEFTDPTFEVIIQEDQSEVIVSSTDDYVIVDNGQIELLTIAEQGPSGVGGFPIAVGNTPPTTPSIGDLWIDTN